MLNISPLFFSTVQSPTFLEELEVPQSLLNSIKEARTIIRGRLREALPVAMRALGYADVAVKPRFVTQGSMVYGLLNKPAHPVQQIDLDDGLYLPLEFVKLTGEPSRASAMIFDVVEQVLVPLVAEHGWKIDNTKERCIRIELNQRAHLDMPLYAIPSEEFLQLKMALDSRHAIAGTVANFDEDEDLWYRFPEDQVLVAHRVRGWQKSDPRPLKKWFDCAVEQHGEQLRRIVRDLKAYRDYQWVVDGPASLLLMVAATEVFEAKSRRDDLALLHVLERMPATLRRGVAHPIDTAESLTKRLGQRGVEEAAEKLERLASCLHSAIYSANPCAATAALIQHLGPRFPNEPHRIEVTPAKAPVTSQPSRSSSSNPYAARISAAAAALSSPPKPWGHK